MLVLFGPNLIAISGYFLQISSSGNEEEHAGE